MPSTTNVTGTGSVTSVSWPRCSRPTNPGRGGAHGSSVFHVAVSSDRSVPTNSVRAVEPFTQRPMVHGMLAGRDLRAHLAEQPEPLGLHVVLVDGLEVLLAGRDEVLVGQEVEALDDAADHLAHAVLDEARPPVRLLHHGALVGALHQLVDLRGHRLLGDLDEP